MGRPGRALLAAIAAILLCLGSSAAAQSRPSEADWKDTALMRAFVKKASPGDRLELYRSWLGLPSVGNPAVSEELGLALAAELPSLSASKARDAVDQVAVAMRRGRGFWADYGEARTRLVGAILDRPEPEVQSMGLSLSAVAPAGFTLTKKRVASILALIGDGRRALSDAEAAALWATAWASITNGFEMPSARALAARVVELSRYSLFTWSSRLPLVSLRNAAAALSDPKLPPGESRLFLALAGAARMDDRGALSLGPRYAGDEATKRLLEAKVKSGDQAYRDLEALAGGAPKPAAFDAANLASLGDWEAGLSLLRSAPPSEAGLIALLDPARPSQAAAAASLLSGGRSPAVVAALSALIKDRVARDPVLLVVAIRALAAAAGSDCLELLVLLCADPAADVRDAACRSLVRLGDRRAVPALLSRLGDPDRGVRIAAIEGLGELRDSRAVDPLGAALLDPGEDEGVKRACAKSLGSIGDTRTVQVFVKFLLMPPSGSGSDGVARVYAAMSLGRQRERAAVDALLKNIDPTREEDLNYHCVVALGRIADPAGLKSLLPLVKAGLPVWRISPGTRAPGAAYWALLPLEPGIARQFYLDRWNEASSAGAGAKARPDGTAWYSALYLLVHAAKDAPERGVWGEYLEAGLAGAVAEDCVMAGEALDRYPLPALLARAADLLSSLDSYSKSWVAGALIHHAAASMIPAFRALLECEDDYLAYAALASMDHLLDSLPSPLPPELVPQLAGFRARLPSLSPAQLTGGTAKWRDLVQKRLDGLLD